MNGFPILSLTILLPALGVFLIFCIPQATEDQDKNIKSSAIFISLVSFCMALIVWGFFDPTGETYQFVETKDWFFGLGFFYSVGVESLTLPFILIVSASVPLFCMITQESRNQTRVSIYLLLLLLETFILGALCSLSLMMFYIFSEAIAIPLILWLWNSCSSLQRKTLSGVIFWHFMISMVFLGALLYLIFEVKFLEFSQTSAQDLSFGIQMVLAFVFFIYFFSKIFLFPLYICCSQKFFERGGSLGIFGGLGFIIIGFYGMIKYVLCLFPEISAVCSFWIQGVGLIVIFFMGLRSLSNEDFLTKIPLVILLQMGVGVCGLFLGTSEGLTGAIMLALNQLLLWVALLFCFKLILKPTIPLESHRSFRVSQGSSILYFFLGFFLLSSLGFPGTSGFMGVFLVLMGLGELSPFFLVLLSMGYVFLTYSLLDSLRFMFFEREGDGASDTVVRKRDLVVLYFLVFILMGLGIGPSFMTHFIQASIDRMLMKTSSNRSFASSMELYPRASEKMAPLR